MAAQVSLRTSVLSERRQLALVGLGEPAVEHVGDHQPEHPVAQELEPLVGALDPLGRRDGARMGQRAVEQVRIGEAIAEPGLQLVVRRGPCASVVDGLEHPVPADVGRPLPELPRRKVVLDREEAGLGLADQVVGGT